MATGFSQRGRSVTSTGICGRCKGTVLWVTLTGSGRRAPLDTQADPVAGEVYVLRKGAGWALGFIVRDPQLRAELGELGFGPNLHRWHSDTCPKARPKQRTPDD